MLNETHDYDEYGHKLEVLNEWRMHTEPLWDSESDSADSDDYDDTSSEHYNTDSEIDY